MSKFLCNIKLMLYLFVHEDNWKNWYWIEKRFNTSKNMQLLYEYQPQYSINIV